MRLIRTCRPIFGAYNPVRAIVNSPSKERRNSPHHCRRARLKNYNATRTARTSKARRPTSPQRHTHQHPSQATCRPSSIPTTPSASTTKGRLPPHNIGWIPTRRRWGEKLTDIYHNRSFHLHVCDSERMIGAILLRTSSSCSSFKTRRESGLEGI